MKVVTTKKSKELGVRISELPAIKDEGFEFEVTEERYKVLAGANRYGVEFVVPVEDAMSKPEEIKAEVKPEEVKVEEGHAKVDAVAKPKKKKSADVKKD